MGIKYDPGTGIYGMDFYVHLSRPGSRVKNRKLKVGKVGCAHKLKKDRVGRAEKNMMPPGNSNMAIEDPL